ncbi:unnamed protein product, partial [Coregonus sp. 'balchen']
MERKVILSKTQAKNQAQTQVRCSQRGRGRTKAGVPFAPTSSVPVQPQTKTRALRSMAGQPASTKSGTSIKAKARGPQDSFKSGTSRRARGQEDISKPETNSSKARGQEVTGVFCQQYSSRGRLKATCRPEEKRSRGKEARLPPSWEGMEEVTSSSPTPNIPATTTVHFGPGIMVQRSCKHDRGAKRASRRRKRTNDQRPCSRGLDCAVCGQQLLPVAEGELQSTVCDLEQIDRLRGTRGWGATAIGPAQCPCLSPRHPCHHNLSILLVSGASWPYRPLKAIFSLTGTTTPQEHTHTHTPYNAIWEPVECSVTRLPQCRGCAFQNPSSSSSAAVVAAEIQHPRDPTLDQ